MKNIAKVRNIFVALACLLVVSASAVVITAPQQASAELKDYACGGANISLNDPSCSSNNACVAHNRAGDCTERESERSINNLLANIINIFTIIVGIVATIMIIIGGFKFVTSGGDSGKITSARQTVIYALIGAVIAALSQIIVRFVLNKL